MPAPTAPEHLVAFVFDDVHLRFEDVVRVRDAATRFVAHSLSLGDRIAIVTTSGRTMLDFTDDGPALDAATYEVLVCFPSYRLPDAQKIAGSGRA